MIDSIVAWLSQYAENNKRPTLVVGVSGGIDSAVTSTLCAKTGLKTIAVIMRIKTHDPLSTTQTNWLTHHFENVTVIDCDLNNVFEQFQKTAKDINCTNELAFANTRSRIRMITLYQIAQSHNGLVVGTGNKIEDFGVGFFTKYGDGGVDISPIADVYKSDVYKMAYHLGIPKEIQMTTPTDGLWDDERTDEDQLCITYDELENVMKHLEGEKVEVNEKTIKIYAKHRRTNKHKMLPIPVYREVK